MLKRLLPPVLLSLLLALLCLPVLAVFASWLQIDRPGWGLLAEMAATVLPDYALTTLALCLAVALGVARAQRPQQASAMLKSAGTSQRKAVCSSA